MSAPLFAAIIAASFLAGVYFVALAVIVGLKCRIHICPRCGWRWEDHK